MDEKWIQALDRYREIIPDYPGFLDALDLPLPVAIRANTLKMEPPAFLSSMRRRGYDLEPVPGMEEGFLLAGVESPGATLEYFLGDYHIQGVTSMVPAKVLGPRPGEAVLDLCAAPGGKTTHLAQLMGNRGLVVANDVRAERLSILRSHVDRLGTHSVLVCRYPGQAFPLRVKFSRVLVDPPCSAEGTCRPGSPPPLGRGGKVAEHLVRVQKALLLHALEVLRPGGTLVYSTCTYAPEENEAVVDQAVTTGRAELLPVSTPLPHSRGLASWEGASYHPDMVKTARFYPHRLDSWGFFVAHLRKPG